ncbi:MAG: RNA-binding S4 domain-containing protein [Gammaproteobacteria bacterium]
MPIRPDFSRNIADYRNDETSQGSKVASDGLSDTIPERIERLRSGNSGPEYTGALPTLMLSMKNPSTLNENDSIRLDKWLWAARFFKTRKLAADAIAGGKVHLNGQRTKPGKDIKIGAKIEITKDRYSWDITIVGISPQRLPASKAVLLYQETPESHAKRQEFVAQMRDERELLPHVPDRRPNKKERRQIHRFKRE